MRDLMVIGLRRSMRSSFWPAGSLGNTALWIALLVFLGARGIGQFLLYPRLAQEDLRQP